MKTSQIASGSGSIRGGARWSLGPTSARRRAMLVATAALVLIGKAPADAAQINTSAASCTPDAYTKQSVVNNSIYGVSITGSESGGVWCSVPREPLAAGETSALFYFDGDNYNGAETVCTISVIDYTGTFLGTTSFGSYAAHYDVLVTLPASEVPTYAYVSGGCVLAGNQNSFFRGITAID